MDPLIVSIDGDETVGPVVARSVAHAMPGVLHLAVSVQVFDPNAGWLLQRRASSKAAFASRWTNTCCTHPAPAEGPGAAVLRRVREELELVLRADQLIPAGVFTYRAVDQASGLVEYELDHVFLAVADTADVVPAEAEISELAWLGYGEAMALVTSESGAPWAAEVLRRSAEALGAVGMG